MEFHPAPSNLDAVLFITLSINLLFFSNMRTVLLTKGPLAATVLSTICFVWLMVTVSMSLYHPPYLNKVASLSRSLLCKVGQQEEFSFPSLQIGDR